MTHSTWRYFKALSVPIAAVVVKFQSVLHESISPVAFVQCMLKVLLDFTFYISDIGRGMTVPELS